MISRLLWLLFAASAAKKNDSENTLGRIILCFVNNTGARFVATYLIDCVERSDPDCWGELEIDIAIDGLSDEQLTEIVNHGKTRITEKQLSSSGRTLEPEDEVALKKNGWIEAVIEVDACGACDPSEADNSEDDMTAL